MDAHGYLLGIHAFVHGGDRYLTPGSLSGAAFWVGLRQEIYSAVMNQEPVRINLVHALVDRTLSPTHDYGWANRACVHCADVLNFCFGEQSGRSSTVWWSELDEYNRGWTNNLSPAFTPVFYRPPDHEKGEAFPEIWYQSACHGKLRVPESTDRVVVNGMMDADMARPSNRCAASHIGGALPHLVRSETSPDRRPEEGGGEAHQCK